MLLHQRVRFVEASSILAQPSKNDTTTLVTREVQPTISARSSDSNLKAAETGRPRVGVLIEEMMATQKKESRVLVAGCGPETPRHEIRKAVAGVASVEKTGGC